MPLKNGYTISQFLSYNSLEDKQQTREMSTTNRPPQSQQQAPFATGGYGCVYRPPITCKGVPSPDKASQLAGTVSKLQLSSRMAKNELLIGKLVAKLPRSQDYFVTPESTCQVPVFQFPVPLASGCSPVSDGATTTTQIVIIQMRDIPHQKLGWVPPKSNEDELRNMLRNLLEGFPHCLQAIGLLQERDEPIVHFDLKADNIFAPAPPQLPLIADFGISFLPLKQTTETIKGTTIAYEPGYYIWPPEIHLLAFLLHARRSGGPHDPATPEELKGVAKRIATAIPLAPKSTAVREAEIMEFFGRFNSPNLNSVFAYVMEHWKKIDLYSICISFGMVLQAYELGEEGDYLAELKTMMQEGMRADPAGRPNLNSLLEVTERLLDGAAPQTINGLMTVRGKTEENRATALATLAGQHRTLSRLTTRLDMSLTNE